MGRQILLTGGTGYLGGLLLHSLVKTHQVVLLKRKTSNLKRISDILGSLTCYDIEDCDVQLILNMHKIDTVMHLATSYGRDGTTSELVDEANLHFPTSILQATKNSGVKYFINTDTSLPESVNHYAQSKKNFLSILKQQKHFKCIVNVVPEYFYGVGDDQWKLITMILKKLMNNDQFIEFTSGKQSRDFIHITDTVNAYLCIVDNLDILFGFKNFSISTENPITIKALAEMCKALSENTTTELIFGALPDRKNEIYQSNLKSDSLRRLGWIPKISLKEGILDILKNN